MADDDIIAEGEQAALALWEFRSTIRGLEDGDRLHELLDVLESTSEYLHRVILEVARYARGRSPAAPADESSPVEVASRQATVQALREAARAAEHTTYRVQRVISEAAGLTWPEPAPEMTDPLRQRGDALEPDASHREASPDAGRPSLER